MYQADNDSKRSRHDNNCRQKIIQLLYFMHCNGYFLKNPCLLEIQTEQFAN